ARRRPLRVELRLRLLVRPDPQGRPLVGGARRVGGSPPSRPRTERRRLTPRIRSDPVVPRAPGADSVFDVRLRRDVGLVEVAWGPDADGAFAWRVRREGRGAADSLAARA